MKKPWLMMFAAVLLPGGLVLAAAAGGMSGLLDPAPPPPAPTTAPLSLTGKWIIAGMSGEDVLRDGPDRLAGSLPWAATPDALDATADRGRWAGGDVAALSPFALEWLGDDSGGGGGDTATGGAAAGVPPLVPAPSVVDNGGPLVLRAASSGGGGDGDTDVGNSIDTSGGEGGTVPDPVPPSVPLPPAAVLFAVGLGATAFIGRRRRPEETLIPKSGLRNPA